ncbi:hypothetical protein OG339_47280 (plasmid) [Streptosporangium sp. NBC_01495]|uniref:hypothetical protein n=1 Tax=Streptosporangium sp. NBC_01495 TaxID=2903899 RepID=UPI002E31F89D|nr:hypothetical protein [Streptosporangium sp. NBC_01495]
MRCTPDPSRGLEAEEEQTLLALAERDIALLREAILSDPVRLAEVAPLVNCAPHGFARVPPRLYAWPASTEGRREDRESRFDRNGFRRLSASEFARRTGTSAKRVMAFWRAWNRLAADGVVPPAADHQQPSKIECGFWAYVGRTPSPLARTNSLSRPSAFRLSTGCRRLVHHRQLVRCQAVRTDGARPGRNPIIDQARGEPRRGHALNDDGDVVIR